MPSVIIAPEQLPPWALRTEIPTVVADQCEDACDLAVWRAIRWLIALSGRDRLGVDARTIAAHAKVDVKTALRCIHGDKPESTAKRRPRSPKRGLVGLGLLEVVGYQAVGKLKPRPVYRIPRWIEEQNAHYTRELLARLGMEPPAPAPPPGQAALPLSLDPNTEQAPGGTEAPGAARGCLDPHTDQGVSQGTALADPHGDQEGAPDPHADQGCAETAIEQQDAGTPAHSATPPDPHGDQGGGSQVGAADPNPARWREGIMEGGREGMAPPPTLPSTANSAQAGRTLPVPAPTPPVARQSREGNVPRPPTQPLGALPPPADPSEELFDIHPHWVAGALPAHPLDLWRRACAARRPIDDDQLAMLASEHDAATGGNGWYWVGRAILAAALSEDIHTVAKVRRTLERWRAEDTYGSDAPAARRPQAVVSAAAPRPGRSTVEPRPGRTPLSARLNLGGIFEEV